MQSTLNTQVSSLNAFAYLITMRTYASWLHGDERGSIDPKHNKPGTPALKPSIALKNAMRQLAHEPAFYLDEKQRQTVLDSMISTCQYNHWHPLAIHVRINHAHLVVQSNMSKEKTAGKLKCYATKDLKKYHTELLDRKNFWSRHASTKNIWAPEALFPALYYVVKRQGKPMALYYDKVLYNFHDEQLYECYYLND